MASQPSFWLTTKGLAAIGLIGAATYFLLIEHSEHLFQFLPFLILLLCPLMHLFMHGGHGHGGHNHNDSSDADEAYRRGLKDGRKQSDDSHIH